MGNFFTDAIQTDTRFQLNSRVKDRALLEPVMRKAVHAIIQDAQAMGIALMGVRDLQVKGPFWASWPGDMASSGVATGASRA